MSFIVRFNDNSELPAEMVQEYIRNNALTNKRENRLALQYSSDGQANIDSISAVLEKEGNLSSIEVYDGDKNIARYDGYARVESITKTLQTTAPNKKFMIDIQLAKY